MSARGPNFHVGVVVGSSALLLVEGEGFVDEGVKPGFDVIGVNVSVHLCYVAWERRCGVGMIERVIMCARHSVSRSVAMNVVVGRCPVRVRASYHSLMAVASIVGYMG